MAITLGTAPPDFDDWNGLLTLLQQAFAYMAPRIDPPSSLNRLDADGLRHKAQRETLIIARDGPQLLGCAFVELRVDCAYVGKVAVAESARGLGIGRRLIAAAEQLARDHRRPCLELQTRIELVDNHRTFAALGFSQVAATAHPGYDRPTSITMRKALPPDQPA